MERKKMTMAVLLCAAMAINAAVIFQDDFSNPGISNQNWNPSSSEITKSFSGGECTATNTSSTNGVLLIHELDNLPSSFTISAKVNCPADKAAGIYFCLGISDNKYTGYELLIFELSRIIVWKHGGSGSALVFQGRSAYMVSGYNEIMISGGANKFNIFCNGQFAGAFTDTDHPSGHIALEISAGATVKFDDVKITDQIVLPIPRTCFSDDFDNANLPGWIAEGKGDVSIRNDSLSIVTSDSVCYFTTDLELNNFVAKVTVSHRNGSANSLYGLYFQGRSLSEEGIFSSGFVITGNRRYGVFTPLSKEFSIYNSSKIKGAAYIEDGQSYYFHDTLEVSKQQNSGYIFKANNSPLCTIPDIGLVITGVGLYCTDSLNLLFDDFVAAEGTEAVCGQSNIIRNITSSKMLNIVRPRRFVIDPLGRTIPGFSDMEIKRSLSPGLYIQADQKKPKVVIER